MVAQTVFTELPGAMSASAYIDPYFSIDPSNADPGAYSILTSPGIGNAPSPAFPALQSARHGR
jgi:hypothetical protein